MLCISGFSFAAALPPLLQKHWHWKYSLRSQHLYEPQHIVHNAVGLVEVTLDIQAEVVASLLFSSVL